MGTGMNGAWHRRPAPEAADAPEAAPEAADARPAAPSILRKLQPHLAEALRIVAPALAHLDER